MAPIYRVVVAICVAVPALRPTPASAQDEVLVRVVDVGAGLCTVTKAPASDGPHYMIFDAGTEFPFNSKECLEEVAALVGGDEIDLMIISHPDADHVHDADDILDSLTVRRIIRTGHERADKTFWTSFDQAVERERLAGATVDNLGDAPLTPGEVIQIGDATVTLVAGWHDWLAPESFDSGEDRNVISIVVRLEYHGRSVLFGGDTIGRRKDDAEAVCKNAEEFMVANSHLVPIRSNVVIAPHHGGNNGSSSCFVEAVFGMRCAERYFSVQGYDVQDRSKNHPYDLECVRGAETLLVEVKGTTTSGAEVLLTKNEVELAQDPETKTVLFIQHDVQLERGDPRPSAAGGHTTVLRPWQPEPNQLTAIAYRCRLQ